MELWGMTLMMMRESVVGTKGKDCEGIVRDRLRGIGEGRNEGDSSWGRDKLLEGGGVELGWGYEGRVER
jgi:hypothetical protein